MKVSLALPQFLDHLGDGVTRRFVRNLRSNMPVAGDPGVNFHAFLAHRTPAVKLSITNGRGGIPFPFLDDADRLGAMPALTSAER